MPHWLPIVAWISIAAAILCAAVILIDILAGHRQQMGIMNVVWPITALYAGPLGLWAYYRLGRRHTRDAMRDKKMAKERDEPTPGGGQSFAASVSLATTHCGAGCSLGDLIGENVVALAGLTLLGRAMFAAWVADFIVAYLLGIVFQYFTIAPMRGLNLPRGIWAAVKADTLSLIAWQVGMYGWMAITTFLIFHRPLGPASGVFWFMMQIGMLAGFVTAYPVNWLLVRGGLKEAM